MRKYVHELMSDQKQSALDQCMKFFLWVASLFYGVTSRLWQAMYLYKIVPSYRAPRLVLSVGNITTGGVGKTPLVVSIVQLFLSRGRRVAILTRGYMPQKGAPIVDEAAMLKEMLPDVPVMIGRNRRESINECLKHHAVDVFICDDAFSHWPLQRDLDIVAIDAVNPFGNGHLIPRGILRENMDALKRAHLIVLTKTNHPQAKTEDIRRKLGAICPHTLIVESVHKPTGLVDMTTMAPIDHYHLKGVSVVAFCGIADPGSFKQSVHEAGLHCVHLEAYLDHHSYAPEDFARLAKLCQQHQVKAMVTTHKDAVKLKNYSKFFDGIHLYYLQIELEMTYGKNVFIDRISSLSRY